MKDSIEKAEAKIPQLRIEADALSESPKELSGLVQRKQESEEFVRKFALTNGLTTEDTPDAWRRMIPPPSTPVMSPEVQQMARNSWTKIQAIQLYKEQTGVSLAEAKEAVERFALKGP